MRPCVVGLVLLAACGSTEAPRALVDLNAVPPGADCAAGGVYVLTGTDDDGDGKLGESEVDERELVCSGSPSTTDPVGDVLVATEVLAPGSADCASGGARVSVGHDENGDGVLSPTEVESSDLVCFPLAPGLLVRSTPIDVGDPTCPDGGTMVEVGRDEDDDDVLDDPEVESATPVCAPEAVDALPVLVRSVPLSTGGSCALGGDQVEVGYDLDGDQVLDDDEVLSAAPLCVDGRPAVLIRTEPVAPGEDCALGGYEVQVGEDADGDGEFDDDERMDADFVCAVDTGGTGAPIAVVMRTKDIDAGTTCTWGGTLVEIGPDIDADTVLDDGEVTGRSSLCAAAPPEVPVVLAQSSPATVGQCPHGGTVLTMGIDADGDGVLDPSEVTATAPVCRPADPTVPPVLVTTTVLDPDEPCADGGTRVESGLDLDRDGTLDVDEVTGTADLCDPPTGGTVDIPAVLLRQVPIAPRAGCRAGGTRFETGFDVDEDGVLDDAEVSSGVDVCDKGILGAVVDGDLVIDDARDMLLASGVEEVTGNVDIRTANLSGLGALQFLTKVGGSLRLARPRTSGTTTVFDPIAGLTNLDGLAALEEVGGDLLLLNLPDLTNLDGLAGLRTVGGTFAVSQVPAPTLDALTQLTDVGDLYWARFPYASGDPRATTAASGLPALTHVHGYAVLSGSAWTDLPVLSQVETVEGTLISGDYFDPRPRSLPSATFSLNLPKLTDTEDFTALRQVGVPRTSPLEEDNYPGFRLPDTVTSLAGLANVEAIYIDFELPAGVSSLAGLESVTYLESITVPRAIDISTLTSLVDAGRLTFTDGAFGSLAELVSARSIQIYRTATVTLPTLVDVEYLDVRDAAAANVAGLGALESVGQLQLVNVTGLSSFPWVDGQVTVHGALLLSNLPQLTSLTGVTITPDFTGDYFGYISLSGCPNVQSVVLHNLAISSIATLASLETTEQSVCLSNLASLTSVSALGSLREVNGGLSLSALPLVTAVDLPALTTVESGFGVSGLAAGASVGPFASLESIASGITISTTGDVLGLGGVTTLQNATVTARTTRMPALETLTASVSSTFTCSGDTLDLTSLRSTTGSLTINVAGPVNLPALTRTGTLSVRGSSAIDLGALTTAPAVSVIGQGAVVTTVDLGSLTGTTASPGLVLNTLSVTNLDFLAPGGRYNAVTLNNLPQLTDASALSDLTDVDAFTFTSLPKLCRPTLTTIASAFGVTPTFSNVPTTCTP